MLTIPDLPTSEDELYAWVVVIMALYMALHYGIRFVRLLRLRQHQNPGPNVAGSEAVEVLGRKDLINHIFNAGTFALSLMILVGIFEPSVLKLIGNTRPFLAVAAFAGFFYALHALFSDQ